MHKMVTCAPKPFLIAVLKKQKGKWGQGKKGLCIIAVQKLKANDLKAKNKQNLHKPKCRKTTEHTV
jgi:hypothetical protein